MLSAEPSCIGGDTVLGRGSWDRSCSIDDGDGSTCRPSDCQHGDGTKYTSLSALLDSRLSTV